MAVITNQIQWASNTAELKASIAAGTGSIVAMKDAVDRTARSLGGEGLLRAAHNTTAAVQQLGGATRLTAAEKERINLQLTKAIEKYQLLGQQAPRAMLDLAAATRNTESAGKGFSAGLGQINGLLATFGVGVSVGALVGFGRTLLNTADQLVKVADRTGLTTTEVQRLKFVAEQSGNTLDQMTSAVSRLQNGLVTEKSGVVATVKALGLNFEELRRATPFEQMESIATAIAKVPDPTARAAMAMALFGKSGAEILPTLISDFANLGNAAPTMSDKTVRALDAAGDALNLFGATIKVWAAESFNAASGVFDHLVKWAFAAAAAVLNATATLLDMASKIPGASTVFDALGISVSGVREQAQWFTDAAGAQAAQITKVDVEVRKTTSAFVDFDVATGKAGASTSETAKAVERAAKAQASWNEALFQANAPFQAVIRQTAMLAPAVRDNAASLNAYDLIAITSTAETGRLAAAAREAEAELRRMGLSLDFTAHSANNASQQVDSATGIFGRWGEGLKSIWQGMSGGDGMKGLLGNLGDGVIEGFGHIISGGVSSLISSGVGLAVTGLKKLFGGIFGKSEGRKQLEEANANIEKLKQQLLETHGSLEAIIEKGGEAGQALADAWGSQNREGLAHLTQLAGEFNAQLAEEERLHAQNARALEEQERIGRGVFSTLTGDLNVLQARVANTESLQRFQGAMTEAARTGQFNIGGVISIFGTLRESIGSQHPAIIALEQSLVHYGQTGVLETDKINAALAILLTEYGTLRSTLSTGITIPVRVQWHDLNLSRPSEREEASRMTDEQKRSIIAGFLRDNANDRHRIPSALGISSSEATRLGFQGGTQGRFLDFGAATDVTMHGRERIMTEAEGRGEVISMAAVVAEIRALRAEQAAQRRALRDDLFLAVRDGTGHRRAG